PGQRYVVDDLHADAQLAFRLARQEVTVGREVGCRIRERNNAYQHLAARVLIELIFTDTVGRPLQIGDDALDADQRARAPEEELGAVLGRDAADGQAVAVAGIRQRDQLCGVTGVVTDERHAVKYEAGRDQASPLAHDGHRRTVCVEQLAIAVERI